MQDISNKNEIIIPAILFGPINLFKILYKKKILIEIHESYPKQSFRNRYLIGGPNNIQALTIPIIKIHGNNTKSKDVEIDYSTKWVAQHLKSLNTAYSASPFYQFYIDYIAAEFNTEHKKLLDLNLAMFKLINKWLSLDITYDLSSNFIKETEANWDLRKYLSPKKTWYRDNCEEYLQCFTDKFSFRAGLSIIDLLFNLGPESSLFIKN